jgi:hypothetical protein
MGRLIDHAVVVVTLVLIWGAIAAKALTAWLEYRVQRRAATLMERSATTLDRDHEEWVGR